MIQTRRNYLGVRVTRAPSDRWVAQQLKETTAFGAGPRYLLHDNDSKYGTQFSLLASGTEIQEVCIPPQSPYLNAHCERFIGSLRRECLDHILILHERQLHKVLRAYVLYFNRARPHQGIEQQLPEPGQALSSAERELPNVIALPVLGGFASRLSPRCITRPRMSQVARTPGFHAPNTIDSQPSPDADTRPTSPETGSG